MLGNSGEMPADSNSPSNDDQPKASIGRRELLLGGAAALVLASCSSDSSDKASGTTTTSATSGSTTTAVETTTTGAATTTTVDACVLSPELTAGPYYLANPLNRTDITEGLPGTPLEFKVQVLALPECAPLAGAAVDIWHCDAGGEYSGWNGNSLAETESEGKNDKSFLRGVQLTDENGVATFTTIFPGFYDGRTVHIHLKVIEGGKMGDTYAGGHVAHIGQAFFEEALTAEIVSQGEYAKFTHERTTNDQDSIFAQAGPGAVTSMAAKGNGWGGTFTCMVDPDATPAPAPLF